MTEHHDHQAFESAWWGDCANSFGEEAKQITYAHRMGLTNVSAGGHWPVYDAAGRLGELDRAAIREQTVASYGTDAVRWEYDAYLRRIAPPVHV